MIEPLESLESSLGWRNAGTPYADEYSLGFLALELAVLNDDDSAIKSIVDFWRQGGVGVDWHDAFERSCSLYVESVYSVFEPHRSAGFPFCTRD